MLSSGSAAVKANQFIVKSIQPDSRRKYPIIPKRDYSLGNGEQFYVHGTRSFQQQIFCPQSLVLLAFPPIFPFFPLQPPSVLFFRGC
jgi:hypothetical protein